MFLYAVERGADGVMKIAAPPTRWPSLQELHARRCFLLGITEPAKVAKLWAEEVARRKARADQNRPGGRHGRR